MGAKHDMMWQNMLLAQAFMCQSFKGSFRTVKEHIHIFIVAGTGKKDKPQPLKPFGNTYQMIYNIDKLGRV